MPQPQQSAVRNRLLQALSTDDYALLQPHLEPMKVVLKQTLIAPHEPIKQLFFPETGFNSITTNGRGSGSDSGGKVEVGIIGREGLVGAMPVLLGTDRTPHHHFVQNTQDGGDALCIATEALCAAVSRSPSLHRLLLRSAQVQFLQTAQTAFTNATYTIDVRLARWLLMCQDRVDGEELQITHEFVSMMLGVQRSSSTLAMQSLEGHRLIRARRGRVAILDREALEAVADEGYGLPEAEYARLIEGA